MSPTWKKIIAGALGYVGTFLTTTTSYLTGIVDQGGTLNDYEPIRIVLLALVSISGGVAALGALLAKSPNEKEVKTNTAG